MKIRPETPCDYAAIAAVNARAFGERAAEALIVALHRHRAAFDPDLSLVAEEGGQVVGHVLFSPRDIRLLGQTVRAVNLAPIAIEPAYQGRGIGGRLILEGHAVAQAKGYQLSFLLGHTSYYPRFGYQTRAYGASTATVAASGLAGAPTLSTRTPTAADMPALRALWIHEEGAVDFAIDPGPALLDWLSPNPAITAAVWLRGEAVVGYTRIHSTHPAKPRMFLAADAAAARAMAARIAHASESAEVVLPLHPSSASASAFNPPEGQAWDAAMVCPLTPSPFEEYYAQTQARTLPAGRPIWPVEFDLD